MLWGEKLTGTNQNTLGTVVKQNPGSWKKVENKRKRTVVVGTNTAAVRVHGAPPPSRDLVIERVAQYTSEHDIKEYIEEHGVKVRSLALMSHVDAKYLKFKLEISKNDLGKVYASEFWPCGISVRKYFPPREGLQQNVRKSANNAGARSDGGSGNEEDTLIKQWTDD